MRQSDMTWLIKRKFEGRHAVVTGGGRGIGAAIAAAIVGEGAKVTIMGRDQVMLDKHARELGPSAQAVLCDVTDEAAVRKAFDAARAGFGDIQILVNNAGQAKSEKFMDTTRELWDRMLTVNLTSMFLCTQQVLPAMIDAKHGRIVNIASTVGLKGASRMTAYTASKHGVVGLTRALALETVRHGVTVNAVCPGYTDTDMTEQGVRELMDAKKVSHDEARAMVTRVIPRGTLTSPKEVASTVVWLCSPDATGITGQAIVVSGGEIT
jgi:NAD(P)-dependent dehydrogenase (short-subunit alcohol dehydrogenase family)